MKKLRKAIVLLTKVKYRQIEEKKKTNFAKLQENLNTNSKAWASLKNNSKTKRLHYAKSYLACDTLK